MMQDGDIDDNKYNYKGSRFSHGTRRHGRFTLPAAAIFVGTALLLNAAAIIFGSGFGGKGSLRLRSLSLVENEDKIDNSLQVVEVEKRRIIPPDIAEVDLKKEKNNEEKTVITEARGDDPKKVEASIPQVLWQTAKSHNAPADVAKIMSTWSIMNPNLDQRLLDDFEVLSFMMQHFNSSVVKAFKNLPLPAMRADFFRLAVMYHEGGIYADVDVSSNVPIHEWQYDDYGPVMESCDVVIGMDEEVHVSNWGFASVKEHILFQKAIELSLSRFLEHGVDVTYEHFVHYTTGPGVFTDALMYLARKAGCVWEGKGARAQEMYHSCRSLLKEKYSICYVDDATQRKWFLNHYSSHHSNLQSEDWVKSWKETAQELYATATKKQVVAEEIFPENILQRNAGTGWKMTNFMDDSVASGDHCDLVPFTSTTGKTAQMCVHSAQDIVSDSIRQHQRWGDCDHLPARWNASRTGAKNEVYVEIGANIGSCVMEILLSTDANVVAFEPTPRNYEVLSRTIYLLGPEYQQRVALFPIALGPESIKSLVYSAVGNMGNSVVGKPIQDLDVANQQFSEPVDIFIERIDSILTHDVSVPLMKLDAQGFECQILDGMSSETAANIHVIKFEQDSEKLKQQGCMDLLPRLRSYGFAITDTEGEIIASDHLNCGVCDAYATRMETINGSAKERVIPITATEAREDDPKKEEATASVDSNDQFMIVPNVCNVPEDRNKIFDEIYEKGGWGKSIMKAADFYGEAQWPPKAVRQNSASGPGSELGRSTQTSLQIIKDTIAKYKVTSMCDIPCGDVNWVLDSFETDSLPYYVGLDIVRPVIEVNKQRFAHHKNKQFHFWDAVSCTLPKLKKAGTEVVPFDLVHVRDVIQHMDVEQGIQFFCNVFKSGAKVLITTTYPSGDNPKPGGFVEGEFYNNNLSKEPFSFPVSDSCTPTHPTDEGDDTCVYDLSEGWVQDFIANKCMKSTMDDSKKEEATTADISETKTVVAKVDNGGIIDAFDMEVYAQDKEQSNDCLISVSHVRNIRLYSQNDEDGALLQILRCMGGHGRKEYFEFGSEGGTEVNTRILRDLYGWKGHLLDGNNENPEISLHKEFFTPSNIVSLLEKYLVDKELDVLSIDTDYDDFWTAREILVAGYKPRVLIIEYNVNLGQSWSVSVEPKPIGEEMSTHWRGDCYFGASAHAMILLMQAFGYTPVFSNDVNLMFVQLEQALNLDMMIPSIDRFPGPLARLLHANCSGRTWKEIDLEAVKSKASDPALSHTAFAASFSDIVLHEKGDYEGNQGGDLAWRIFYKE
jgi:FkbM family methyltransferase